MKCYLCDSTDLNKVAGKVRDKPEIDILKCNECSLVFLDYETSIEYYRNDYTEFNHANDTWRSCLRGAHEDDLRRSGIIKTMAKDKVYCDVGCGAGGLLQMVQPFCRQVIGVEPQTKWHLDLVSEGFTIANSIDEIEDDYFDVISLFHVLEHIADPIAFLISLKRKLRKGGTLVVEVPNADDALLTVYKSKPFSHFTYWSPHLYLFSQNTLSVTLIKAGFTDHIIKQFQRYPLANHLMWLANGIPGGHETWSFLNSPDLAISYEKVLAQINKCDTLFSYAN